MKNFMKKFNSLDMWVKYLLGACLFLLVISLFWPRRSIGVRIVPVPGSPYYKAVLEGFSDDDKLQNVLTDTNNKPVFAAFVVDWCGYCKKLKPIWSKFEKDNEGKDYHVISIDCTKNKDLAEKHKVKGYPTIKYLKNGLNDTNNTVDYNGERTHDEFYKFLSQYH